MFTGAGVRRRSSGAAKSNWATPLRESAIFDAGPAVAPHRSRSVASARGPAVHAAPGRPRCRRHQDREVRQRGRHARVGAAVSRGRRVTTRARPRTICVQSQQALGRRRFHAARRARACPRARAAGRHRRREPQGRRPREARARLRKSGGAQSASRVLLDHRLRADGALCGSGRLRFHHAGDGRVHEHDRRARRPAGRRAAEGRHRDLPTS